MNVTGRARDSSPTRIPSLDGIRAFSIIAVIAGHLAGTRGYPMPLGALARNPYIDVANIGVRVFFVLSGFLITGLLIRELEDTGSLHLGAFYLRRTVRIFPAYYAFLAALAALSLLGIVHTTRADFAHALTYTMNYAREPSWQVGHLWSLGVEEQFYLLWPLTLALVGIRRGRIAALAVVAVVPLVRLGEATFWPASLALMGNTFETAADALALGCLLALSREALWNREWYRRLLRSWWPVVAFLAAGVALSLKFRLGLLLGAPLTNLAIVLGVDRAIRYSTGRVGRILNLAPVAYVGTLSYSIYLWQQLFLNRGGTHVVNAFPLNVGAAFGAALVSYYAVERPFLRLRPRLEARFLHRAPRIMPTT